MAISPCQEGEFFHPMKQMCLQCRKCSVVEYELRKCEGINNRVCKSCPNDTYLGDEKQCRNCTVCLHGTILRCNSTMDSFCMEKEEKPDRLSQKYVIIIAVCVGFLLFVVLSIIAIVYCVRRRRQQDKQNEEAAQLEQVSEAEDGNESPHEEDALG